jgi:phospholipid/cholesterol/gamma-HCH transport system substrate-binding protein
MTVLIKNVLIGIFVLVAAGIVTFMLLFLHPTVGDNGKTLHVRFTDLDKVNTGTRVTFAGRPVGEVVRIQEVPDARFNTEADADGDVYVYELELKVDSGVNVYDSDQIVIRTSGLLGERNIEINPRPILKGQEARLVENEIILAHPSGSMEGILKVFNAVAKKFEIVLDDAHEVVDSIKKEEIIAKVAKSIQNIVEITDALNQADKLKEAIENFAHLSHSVNESWTLADRSLRNIHHLTENANISWAKVDNTLDQFNGVGRSANEILAYARQGKGTVGRIFMSDNLYLRLKSVLHKGETVMDDIKTYGILFQSDKRWQRLQAQRLQLAKRLNNPNNFSNYFNNEVDQISASLARVSVVLNESEYYPNGIQQDPQVKRDFADLLRKVEGMQETLKLYNESVIAED